MITNKAFIRLINQQAAFVERTLTAMFNNWLQAAPVLPLRFMLTRLPRAPEPARYTSVTI